MRRPNLFTFLTSNFPVTERQHFNIFRVIFRQMPIPAEKPRTHTMSFSVFNIFGIGFLNSGELPNTKISCIHLSPDNNTHISALQYTDRHASIHLSAISADIWSLTEKELKNTPWTHHLISRAASSFSNVQNSCSEMCDFVFVSISIGL